MAVAGNGGIDVKIDTSDWNRVYSTLREFDPVLARGLRRNVRVAATVGSEAVKAALHQATPEGSPSGPVREALIAGTRVAVSFSAKAAGARITTSGSKLPSGHEAMLKLYNSGSWRHPVFGDRANWVEEQGHPYFEKSIEEVISPTMYAQIGGALEEAIAAIGGKL